mgnify:CR=1 FL=1
MNTTVVLDIFTQAIWIAIKVAAPALIAIMLTGLLVSILQAATQINEQTLSFIPKIIAMTVAVVFAGPWTLRLLIDFTKSIILKIPGLTK